MTGCGRFCSIKLLPKHAIAKYREELGGVATSIPLFAKSLWSLLSIDSFWVGHYCPTSLDSISVIFEVSSAFLF